MANKKVEIALLLKDKFSKELKEADSGFNKLTKTLGGLKGVIGGLVAAGGIYKLISFMKDTTKAAMEQEQADFALAEALKNVGYYSDETFKKLTDLAASLQMTTTYGDETIESIEALFLRFNIAPDLIDKAVQATMDYARAVGKDLRTAALDMAKAAEGNLMMLQRYGVRIDKATFETKGFVAVLDEVEKKFGGAEEAFARTFMGKLMQIKNLWGDLKEEIGNTVIKSTKWQDALDTIKDIIHDMIRDIKENRGVWKDFFENLAVVVKDTAKALEWGVKAFNLLMTKGGKTVTDFRGTIGDADATAVQFGMDIEQKLNPELDALDATFQQLKGTVQGWQFAEDQLIKTNKKAQQSHKQLTQNIKETEEAMQEYADEIMQFIETTDVRYWVETELMPTLDLIQEKGLEYVKNMEKTTKKSVKKVTKTIKTELDLQTTFVRSFADTVATTFRNLFEGVETDFGDMIEHMIITVVESGIETILLNILSAGSGSGVGILGSLLGFKEGGVVKGFRPLVGAFQEGGVVTRPTLALVGEGGEKEYIIPESKFPKPEIFVTVHNANPDTYVEIFTRWSRTGKEKFYRQVVKPMERSGL